MIDLFGLGSSPRVWGQDGVSPVVKVFGRIIPTRVGTRRATLALFALKKDHPHACGDKQVFLLPYHQFQGSSPRVWGQEGKNSVKVFDVRIIPTRVGTSTSGKTYSWHSKDHPHACGDKQVKTIVYRCEKGSSPRVWGQVVQALKSRGIDRIIPTRVGTS